MTARLNPYLSFDGQAEEALRFYADVFGGDVRITRWGDLSMGEPKDAERVMHGQFTSPDGFTLMAADYPGDMRPQGRGDVTVCVSGDDQRLFEMFERLSEGGTIRMPLENQPWGDAYGDFTDRFGVEWGFNIEGGRR